MPGPTAEVDIILYADGKQVATTTAAASGGWTYSFDGLPVYGAKGQIDYTVGEATGANYEMTSVTQPTVAVTLPSVGKWEKHPPNNSPNILMISGASIVAMKKGNAVGVWTMS